MSSAPNLDDKLREYILRNGDDISFTKHFWRECEPSDKDKSQYNKFVTALRMAFEGVKRDVIAETVRASSQTVYTWTYLLQMPKLGHYLKAFLILGIPPVGCTWLTTECSHGYGIPIGQFVKVPNKVNVWDDVDAVLNQLQPLDSVQPKFSRHYLFGFLLGMMIGDASKSKQGRGHRHLGLVLSKKYETNLKIGNFTCECAQAIGLRMHRIKDRDRPRGKPHEFYQWSSQSSPFIDWLYNVGLGLEDGELTTYDAVDADWVLDGPKEFRIGLLQGLAESDGSVSVASQIVEFWIGPNWELIKKLLATFGLRSFRNRDAISLSKSQAIKSFEIPVFSEFLKTTRYQRHFRLASGRRLRREERLPIELRNQIMQLAQDGLSVPEIIERIVEIHGILISFEAAQRWARKNRGAVLAKK